MGEIFFVIKTLIFTIVLVVAMQMKVGTMTIEEHSMDYIHESSIVQGLQGVADGAVKAMGKGFHWASDLLGTGVDKAFEKEAKAKRSRKEARHSLRPVQKSNDELPATTQASVDDGPMGDEID